MKDTLKSFFRFYEMQSTEARIAIIILTTVAITSFVLALTKMLTVYFIESLIFTALFILGYNLTFRGRVWMCIILLTGLFWYLILW